MCEEDESHYVEAVYEKLNNRGGGYDSGVYVFESNDMDEKKHLLKPEVYHLNPEQLAFL